MFKEQTRMSVAAASLSSTSVTAMATLTVLGDVPPDSSSASLL